MVLGLSRRERIQRRRRVRNQHFPFEVLQSHLRPRTMPPLQSRPVRAVLFGDFVVEGEQGCPRRSGRRARRCRRTASPHGISPTSEHPENFTAPIPVRRLLRRDRQMRELRASPNIVYQEMGRMTARAMISVWRRSSGPNPAEGQSSTCQLSCATAVLGKPVVRWSWFCQGGGGSGASVARYSAAGPVPGASMRW